MCESKPIHILVEPSTRDERISLWNHCYKNIKCPDVIVDCKLVELCMFGSCDSYINLDIDSSSGSDRDSCFLIFSQETRR